MKEYSHDGRHITEGKSSAEMYILEIFGWLVWFSQGMLGYSPADVSLFRYLKLD